MSHKVSFVDRKTHKLGSMIFPTRKLAEAYARTMKNGVVEPGGKDDTVDPTIPNNFSFTKLGSKEEEEKRRARVRAQESEQEEAYIEEGTQACLQGASTSEALDRANAARTSETRLIVRVCGGCGKRIASTQTMCYTCRRYS